MRKSVLISFMSVAMLFSFAGKARAAAVDFDSLIPAEQMADEMTIESLAGTTTDESRMEQSEDRRPHPGHHHGGHHPHPHPVPVPAYVYCYASDTHGYNYQAYGYDANATQQAALNQCYASGQGCVARGCHN